MFAGMAVVGHQEESSGGVFCPLPVVFFDIVPSKKSKLSGGEGQRGVMLLISVCMCHPHEGELSSLSVTP